MLFHLLRIFYLKDRGTKLFEKMLLLLGLSTNNRLLYANDRTTIIMIRRSRGKCVWHMVITISHMQILFPNGSHINFCQRQQSLMSKPFLLLFSIEKSLNGNETPHGFGAQWAAAPHPNLTFPIVTKSTDDPL